MRRGSVPDHVKQMTAAQCVTALDATFPLLFPLHEKR